MSFPASDPWYKTYADNAISQKIISKTYPWDIPATRADFIDIFSRALPASIAVKGLSGLTAINSVDDGLISDVPMTTPTLSRSPPSRRTS